MVPTEHKYGQGQPPPLPLELGEIVTVWPGLPEHIKAAVMALVRTWKNEESE